MVPIRPVDALNGPQYFTTRGLTSFTQYRRRLVPETAVSGSQVPIAHAHENSRLPRLNRDCSCPGAPECWLLQGRLEGPGRSGAHNEVGECRIEDLAVVGIDVCVERLLTAIAFLNKEVIGRRG